MIKAFQSPSDKTAGDFPGEEIAASDLGLAPHPSFSPGNSLSTRVGNFSVRMDRRSKARTDERVDPCPLGLRWDFSGRSLKGYKINSENK